VRITRGLALGLMAVLLLGALTAASASASQRSFAAGSYPAFVGSNGQMTFSTQSNFGECGATLSGQLSSASPSLAAGITGSCKKQGTYVGTIQRNGCNFELNSDFNSVSIGPAGCGPISVQLGSCTTYILPQNGIPATYEATTAGGLPAVQVSVSTNKLKYKECSASGEVKENGFLEGNWILTAQTSDGKPTSLSLAPPSYFNLLAAEKYPANLASVLSNDAVFILDGQYVRCTRTHSGVLTGVSEYAQLTPTFSSCTVFAFNNGVVNGNGCQFAISVLTGNQAISCPEGTTITISLPGYGCEATIGSQGSLPGATSENITGKNGRSAVRIRPNMSGLKYTVTNDSGFLCPLNGPGTRTTGAFTDNVAVEGHDSAGPIAIRIGA